MTRASGGGSGIAMRGVNRSVDTPLAVQLLADVVLPLVHDRVQAWEQVAPDIVQRMLLAGMTVDSPADAVVIHPGLFETVAAAEHTLRRAGFNRQNPIRDTYREMAVRSACYLHGGRGRSWQHVVWLEWADVDPRKLLETALETRVKWEAS